eukprot:gene30565-40615_t
MFEARILQAIVLKKIIEAIKDLVGDVNFECSEHGITLQAMDSSHVSLVFVTLNAEGFDFYRCDQNTVIGINTITLSKILKCAGNDDIVTLKKLDDVDGLTLIFESSNKERVSDFEIKLMEIDTEAVGIPDTDYACNVRITSTKFEKIIKDLQIIGDACSISVQSKEGIRFSSNGDIGVGNIMLKHTTSVDKEEDAVVINLKEKVDLNFALRYLNFFTKATSLGNTVSISMSPDVPMVVEYPIDTLGFVRYYLAPKIDDDA